MWVMTYLILWLTNESQPIALKTLIQIFNKELLVRKRVKKNDTTLKYMEGLSFV